MQRILWTAALAALAVMPSACQKEAGAVEARLDETNERLARLEQKLDNLGGARGAVAGQARPERRRPDPAKVYSIPVDRSIVVGPEDAPVTIVEAYEFACPYCEQSRPVLAELRAAYGDKLRIAYKNFLVHPQAATTPALAACAADRQGKFSEMADLIWDKAFKDGRQLGLDRMKQLAAEVGLDPARFLADLEGADCRALLASDHKELAQIGVNATPMFFINGRYVQNRSFEAMKQVIDEELATARQRLGGAERKEGYYAEWVVAKGATAM
jgi:protein-disulfide isomerase